MAENNSIDNLDRQDLLTVLGGFIEQTEQINHIKYECHSRYEDIANELLLTKYKKPKNLVIAYFLAPIWSDIPGWVCALFGDVSLILFLLGLSHISSGNELSSLLGWVIFGTIGYFMGSEEYKRHWLEKMKKKGTYDNEIDAAVDSDPQIIDYKNKLTSLESDATYQQYCSLVPHIVFTLSDIKRIYDMLSYYRADNFNEAADALLQEKHDREVKEKHDREVEKQKQRLEYERRKLEFDAEFAKRQAEQQAEREAKAKSFPILNAIQAHMDYVDEREKKEAAKRADKANELIIKKLKD